MALNSYALTTVQRQKDFLGITVGSYDTIFERLINSVTDFVENYCDRRFMLTTYTNQIYDGTGTNELLLRHYPVTTFTSLEVRDSTTNQSSFSTITSTDYFVKLNQGIIIYAGGISENWYPRGSSYSLSGGHFLDLPQHYRINYTAGYNFDVDAGSPTYLEDVGLANLEYAVWKLIGTWFSLRKQALNVKSERIGEYATSWGPLLAQEDEIREILQIYRRPVYGL